MKFKKLILSNWANIPNQEYDLSDLVFLTGETGVGKSTMLDAIQTLMTASKKGIVLYNAGQDEAQNKKRDKEYRTLQGYFAGEDRFKFSRPNGCRSSIVLTFENTSTEDLNIFSALITGTVSFEEIKGEKKPILDSLHFFIIKNAQITQQDILSQDNKLLNNKELYKTLSLKYEKENVLHCLDKNDYLNTLYGNLWGKTKTTTSQATKAARAFSNFIHARPVDNINAFVRNEFLLKKDMKDEVNALSSTIRSLDKLKKDAKEIEDSINVLKNLDNKLFALVKKWHILGEEHFIYNHYEVLKIEDKILKDEKKYNKLQRDIKKFQNKEKRANLEKNNLSEKLLELNLVKNSNDKIKELEDIERKISESKKNFSFLINNTIRVINKLESINKDLQTIFLHREKFPKLSTILSEFKIILEEFSQNSFISYFYNNDINANDMQYQVISFRDLLDKVIEKYESFIKSSEFIKEVKSIEENFLDSKMQEKDLENKITNTKYEIKSLEENRFFCPSYIQESFEKLKTHLPSCNAHLLYEFVELLDDTWREAIEGFISNNRFCVIVSSEYEQEAIDLTKQLKLNIKIIQGKKVLEDIKLRGKSLNENSIVNLLKITNETVLAYLISSYGDVLQINDSKELTSARRGLTSDCKAASGNLLFTCELKDKRFIFGEEAQRKTLFKMKNELDVLSSQKMQLNVNIDISRQILRLLENLTKDKKLADLDELANINSNYNKYHEALKTKALIDTSDYDEVCLEIKVCEKNISNIEFELKDISKELILSQRSYDEKEIVDKSNIKILEENQEKTKIYKPLFETIYNKLVIFSNQGFENYEKNVISKIDITIYMSKPDNLLSSLKDLWYEVDRYYTVVKTKGARYLPLEITFDELNITQNHFMLLMDFKDDVIQRIQNKESSLSIKYKDEISQANKAFRNTFINDFCHAIYVNIKQGEHTIDRLNDTLRKHKFGNETYKIVRSPADEELKKYQEYFKRIHENNKNVEEGSLFEELEKDGFENVSQSLLDLFMDNEKHMIQLLRISDYRNYNNYDIFQEIEGKSISLSRNGKNSGGQGETSYYIIRSINLQAALKPNETNMHSLQSIIIDESFLKSNEKRSKEILNYLNKSLSFQIICAMPTKNVGTFYEITSSNYHFVQFEKQTKDINSELDYTTFVEFKQRNNKEVKKLFLNDERTLLEEITKNADVLYEHE